MTSQRSLLCYHQRRRNDAKAGLPLIRSHVSMHAQWQRPSGALSSPFKVAPSQEPVMPDANKRNTTEIPLIGGWSEQALGLGFVLFLLAGIAMVTGLMDVILRIFIGLLLLAVCGYMLAGLVGHEIVKRSARKPKRRKLTPSPPVEQDALTLLNSVKSKKVALQKRIQSSLDQLQNSQRALEPRIRDTKNKVFRLDNELKDLSGEDEARALQRRENAARDLTMLQSQHESLASELATVRALLNKVGDQVDMLDNKIAYAKSLRTSAQATTGVQDALLQLQNDSVEMTVMMQDAIAQFEEKQAESSAIEELMAIGAADDWNEVLDDIDLQLSREREAVRS